MKRILSVFLLLVIFASLDGQGIFSDKRDGNEYNVVTISGVTWMAENLKYEANEGAILFEKDPNNKPGYGLLYDWRTAIKACPSGWHLPSGEEFRRLTNFFENKENWGAITSDSTSFGIQLGGLQDCAGTFSEMYESGYYWTSTEYNKSSAEYFSYLLIDGMKIIDISRNADIADIHGTEKLNKYSVRCVKD
jgi:uncharacterized protein (TIGR02145 family)